MLEFVDEVLDRTVWRNCLGRGCGEDSALLYVKISVSADCVILLYHFVCCLVPVCWLHDLDNKLFSLCCALLWIKLIFSELFKLSVIVKLLKRHNLCLPSDSKYYIAVIITCTRISVAQYIGLYTYTWYATLQEGSTQWRNWLECHRNFSLT